MKFISIAFKIVLFIVSIFLFFVAVFIAFLAFSDPNQYKEIIVTQFKEITQQELVLIGPIEVKVFPLPHIKVTDAAMKLDFTPETSMAVSAKTFEFSFNYWIFFVDNKSFKSVKATSATVDIKASGGMQRFSIDEFFGDFIISCCHFSVPTFTMRFGQNDLAGDLLFSSVNEEPEISGHLKANYFTIPSQIESLAFLNAFRQFKGQVDLKVNHLALENKGLKEANLQWDFTKQQVMIESSGQDKIIWVNN